ncbi:MAG: hypothetical protein ACJASV_000530 [Pseudorhodobacter sp.]|jgi:hypothetical protein
MAAGEKTPIMAELKAHPLKEMGKEARDFITNSKALTKAFQPIIWSAKPVLDPRKWNKKSLSDGLSAVARYEMKLLAVRASKIAKDAAGKGGAKKFEDALIKEYKEVKEEILNKVSLAIEEVEADKGDNAKGLKDCKAAFDKLDKVDFGNIFKGPRMTMLVVFTELEEDLEDPDEKRKAKALGEASKNIAVALKDFEDQGKAATTAIETLMKAAKTTKDNKGADPEFIAFATLVLKQEGKISSVLAKSSKFSDALANAEKLVKSGKISPGDAKIQAAIFDKMSNLDGSAKETMMAARKLKPDFKKIEKKLK